MHVPYRQYMYVIVTKFSCKYLGKGGEGVNMSKSMSLIVVVTWFKTHEIYKSRINFCIQNLKGIVRVLFTFCES